MKACCPSCRGSESSPRWSPVLLLHLHIACAEWTVSSSMTSQGQPAWPHTSDPYPDHCRCVRSARREEVWKPSFPSLHVTQAPVWMVGLTHTGQQMEMQQVFLSVPWKWLSTERVTAPPDSLHTIVSWVSTLLWLLLPHSWGPTSGVARCWVLVSPSFSDTPGNASESAVWRCPHRSPGSVRKAECSGHLPSGK